MTKHFNNTLPIELLVNVFQNLNLNHPDQKRDLKACLTVCKSWQVAAELFFGEFSVRVSEASLDILSRDIMFFAKKVKKITLIKDNQYNRFERHPTDNCLVWLENIIPFCTNLLSINIETRRGVRSSYGPTSFYPTTRTHGYHHSVYTIDLIRFLEAVPSLKEFRVSSAFKIKGDSRRTTTNLCLDLLDLTVVYMNTNSLKHIVACLKNIKSLRIKILKLGQEMVNTKELFGYLKDCTSGIEKLSIEYTYRGVIYLLENDKES